jgi:hypothetical protein
MPGSFGKNNKAKLGELSGISYLLSRKLAKYYDPGLAKKGKKGGVGLIK